MTHFTRLRVAAGFVALVLGGCGQGHSSDDGHDHGTHDGEDQ